MNRISLFDEIKKGGYESAVITTFNIDFPFYEDVVLRRMQSAGVDHHIVLVDSVMCAQAIVTRPPIKSGYHYSLAPMRCSAAFHPKLLLLVGKDKGLLAVGSHNLTLSGYGNNLEITNVVKYHRKGAAETLPLFQAAIGACKTWIVDYGEGLPVGIIESFNKILDSCNWLGSTSLDEPEDIGFAYTSRSTSSLWDQVNPLIPDKPSSIFGMSAFFDRSLRFVQSLSDMNPDEFRLAVQSDTVSAPQELLQIANIDVLESQSLLDVSNSQYLHAKLMYLTAKNDAVLISGSANLSFPAWLASGDQANAEAVLMRQGDAANDAFQALGFSDFQNMVIVESLPLNLNDSEGAKETPILIIMVNYDEGGFLAVPWEDSVDNLNIGYQTDLLSLDPIEFTYRDSTLFLDDNQLRMGEIIQIQQDGVIVAFVVIHHEQRIREFSSTGTERKLRHALGSLNTASPDLSVLFSCVGRLMLEGKDSAPKRSKKSTSGKSAQPADEPESLVTDLRDRSRNKASGRLSLIAGGDIGIIMSTLISSLAVDHLASATGLNEDRLGRNEEELVGQDDGLIEKQDNEKESTFEEEIAEIIHRKLNSTIAKLDDYLAIHGKEACHAALGVTIFLHHLMRTKEDYVAQKVLRRLFQVIANRLLSDKSDPITVEGLEDDDFYKSDDWGRLLGYVIWLAYQSGIVMRDRLPISACKEEKDLLTWKNACWLYLAQRVVADKHVQTVAGDLVTETRSDKFQKWFAVLTKHGKALQNGNVDAVCDFELAKSPNGKAFCGYRLVSEATGNQLVLPSISGVGVVNNFAKGYLDVVSSNFTN